MLAVNRIFSLLDQHKILVGILLISLDFSPMMRSCLSSSSKFWPCNKQKQLFFSRQIKDVIPILLFRCVCQQGYTGKHCESVYYPCSPSPCENGGYCREIDSYNYQCRCPPGKQSYHYDHFPYTLVTSGGRVRELTPSRLGLQPPSSSLLKSYAVQMSRSPFE